MEFALNLEQFLYSLTLMGKGLIGIFTVTAIIIFSIWLLNKLTSAKKDK